MPRRTNGKSGGVIRGKGANSVFKRALARSSYPTNKPRSNRVTSGSANLRIGGGANNVSSTGVG